MPRRAGLRDDDMLGRLADLETRLDAVEAGREAPTRADDPLRVPERDERRDTEPRNRQMHVQAREIEPGYPPGMPDSMGGERVPDRTTVIDADRRASAERRAAREEREAAEADQDEPSKAGAAPETTPMAASKAPETTPARKADKGS